MPLKPQLKKLLGEEISSDTHLQKSMRHHQSWWRTFVLGEEQGLHPLLSEKSIGSSIRDGESTGGNFLDEFALKAVKEELENRSGQSKGLIKEDRLFNNLLSSQPLCFNFFGRLKTNLPLTSAVFQQFYPNLKEVTNIHFEFAPNAAQNGDNSAHDVALEFLSDDNKRGLVGLECKYTEPFSPKEYTSDTYEELYRRSEAFSAPYEELINTKYNQLFRNQLIIESALLNKSYDLAYSGLFCYQHDENALTKGNSFRKMLKNGEERFKIITFANLIEAIQKMDIDWETREWSMLLWARYCGTELSKRLTP